MVIDRRAFIGSVIAGAVAGRGLSSEAFAQQQPEDSAAANFSFDQVVAEAKRLASVAYEPPPDTLPSFYEDLSYDQYRTIWFDPKAAIWSDAPTDFRLDLFHPGFLYKHPVSISLVSDGKAVELPFSADLFEYGEPELRPQNTEGMGFAGFRARYPINSPEAHQEFLVFLGASYFRAVARNQVYGLSARGLAIDTGEMSGEEFPAFRRFWIEQPGPGDDTLVINALLDSNSVAGAYRFAVTPGAETTTEVTSELFFRRSSMKVGLAPLTSMFMFGGINRGAFDDYRRAVHDTEGLQMLTGMGEWIWRPLDNPAQLQISGFADVDPRGFGLMQRSRAYEDYLDAEAKYDRRPSLWIEPIGDWGQGSVELVEIPTDTEFNDNIVAYWRPAAEAKEGGHWTFAYRMRWTSDVTPGPEVLYVASSRAGKNLRQERPLFVLDFGSSGEAAISSDGMELQVSASTGKILNPIFHAGQPTGLLRVSFELDPEGAELSELRLLLTKAGKPASETWLYRWTSE